MTYHSPLGASSAERWMNCPGSVTLIKSLGVPPGDESDETEFSREGTAAHAVLSRCLLENADAWEVSDDAEQALAVQQAIDVCRSLITPHGKTYVEHTLSSNIHRDYGGTVDFAHVADSLLNVVDYKHGVGVPVEVDHNPQLLYYAFGILQLHPNVDRVVIRVVQPRAYHPDGPIRRFVISAEELTAWVNETLVPAMHRTATDDTLTPGQHCRFCPAKLICPLMKSLFEAAATSEPSSVGALSDEALGLSYPLVDVAYMYLKALKEEVQRRVLSGRTIAGAKLVNKKSDRVYRAGALEVFKARLGDEAFEVSIKSPAQMEKVSEEAKQLVREWAYQPQTGYAVAPEHDKRRAVKRETATEVFGLNPD